MEANILAYMFKNNDNSKIEFWLSDVLNAQPKQMAKIEKLNSVAIHNYDETNKIAQINDYITTLDSCTCADFDISGRPCKHMYKLAESLGLFSPLVDLNKLIRAKPIDFVLSYLTQEEFEILLNIVHSFNANIPNRPLLYNSHDAVVCRLVLYKCLIPIKCNHPAMDNWFLLIPNDNILKSIK